VQKLTFLILLLILGHSLPGRSNCLHPDIHIASDSLLKHPFTTPFIPNGKYQSVDVKWGLIPLLLGNGVSVIGWGGVEYGFARNQSIGLDFFFNIGNDNRDQYDDTNNPNLPALNYQGLDRSLSLSYRYYLNFRKLREKSGISFYTGAFVRFGGENYLMERGYSSDSLVMQKSHYYSAGALFGFMGLFNKKDNIGYDVNVGVCYHTKEVTSEYEIQGQYYSNTNHFETTNIVPEVSIYWWFAR
jgi:hypothetical protein